MDFILLLEDSLIAVATEIRLTKSFIMALMVFGSSKLSKDSGTVGAPVGIGAPDDMRCALVFSTKNAFAISASAFALILSLWLVRALGLALITLFTCVSSCDGEAEQRKCADRRILAFDAMQKAKSGVFFRCTNSTLQESAEVIIMKR